MKESEILVNEPIEFVVTIDQQTGQNIIKTDDTGLKILTLLLDIYSVPVLTDDVRKAIQTIQ